MGDGKAGRLLHNVEGVAYWAVAAPVLGRLPAALGYHLACRRGDWVSRRQPAKCTEIAGNLGHVLGDDVSPAAAAQVAREWFRLASCDAVDVMRLRRSGRPLAKLVEIRGREHLEAALAAGKGAIICSGHFGSFDSAFSMLGAAGYPVTTIGRWQHNYNAGMSKPERRFWDRVYARPLRRHRKRPNIEPWPGRFDVATRAASVLRANEVLTIAIDAPPLDSDKSRAVDVPFLGRQARLVPGVATLAQVIGAPVLMGFLYRSADYCHQVLEISAPLPMEGELATAFMRCTAEVSAAITRSPAEWRYWPSTVDLATLGLVGKEPDTPRLPELLPLSDESAHPDRASDWPTDRLAAPS
jgi:phosphatidylinositol dimannoside acyltransferase